MSIGIPLHHNMLDSFIFVWLLWAQRNTILFPDALDWSPNAAIALNYTRWSNTGLLLISFQKFSAIKNTLIKSERCGGRQSKGDVTDLINPNTEACIKTDANFSISSNPLADLLEEKVSWRIPPRSLSPLLYLLHQSISISPSESPELIRVNKGVLNICHKGSRSHAYTHSH